MSYRSKFDIDVSNIPQVFSTSFGNTAVNIGINYNKTGDFYTVDLFDIQNKPIITGEKLIYGKRLWRNSVDERIPAVDLVPLDESGKSNICNKETFGKTVFLFIDTVVEDNG
ncbi:hypothetical protein H5S09_04235 [Limosilactobacillus sp. STM2_1]|uniref:Cyanophage baseplate Pam3 plug gp18 domain-containing protein n=1 Tax=Limosilactobacillus rudii TaxID=2759755 RepID=A0A7W3UKB4_9LACO|nr:hypothetical protein [Limosilactobacillus rudii]MBB1078971.1 hypothetical protein [Limosilactobacillus rudii]MBB1097152.1 hypothetical protein [Limosilactobacillus rudii]MCD7134145.1 hypothetical protein [Limosilactobacillus rudii]